jgi:hypothetical protein
MENATKKSTGEVTWPELPGADNHFNPPSIPIPKGVRIVKRIAIYGRFLTYVITLLSKSS